MFRLTQQTSARLLLGPQVPKGERKALCAFLAALGYRHWEETGNPAYKLFLA